MFGMIYISGLILFGKIQFDNILFGITIFGKIIFGKIIVGIMIFGIIIFGIIMLGKIIFGTIVFGKIRRANGQRRVRSSAPVLFSTVLSFGHLDSIYGVQFGHFKSVLRRGSETAGAHFVMT